MTDYAAFLAGKRIADAPSGFRVATSDLNPKLFDWQKEIVQWALARGRAAIFADCGTGKTPEQLIWAEHVSRYTSRPVLILAPLAVAAQTQREGVKFDVPVTICRSQSDIRPGVNITNYEMLSHFTPEPFGGIVADEASILKAFEGVLRKQITEFAKAIPYRLACTATPAPNDLIELTNQSEFLSVMSGKEITALYFRQDGNTTHKWRLRGHARHDFWRWLASWSVALRMPSDLGYPNGAFELPPLNVHQFAVEGGEPPEGMLFQVEAIGLAELRKSMRASLPVRVAAAADLANASTTPWVVWCNLNDESAALAKAIPDAVEVRGSDSTEHKERAALDFASGKVRVIVSKPSIFGWGLNWQHCSNVAFVGLSHSYEQFYQAVRRCWRFGQTRPVECYIITAESEASVVQSIDRKEKQAKEMFDELVRHMSALQLGRSERDEMPYDPQVPMRLPKWMGRAS